MARRFNTTGPCVPGEHYMLPPEARCPGVMDLVEQKHFFVIHAPRQSGKTTLLKSIERQLGSTGKYHTVYCSLEGAQAFPEPKEGMAVVQRLVAGAFEFHPALGKPEYLALAPVDDPGGGLKLWMARLCGRLDHPLVLLFDEVDCLRGGTLITFLRQLRDGYVNRSTIPFVHSLALVGMRKIRDYKVQVRPDAQTLGSASPFNIAVESLTLRSFSRDDIASLYSIPKTRGRFFLRRWLTPCSS